MEVTYILLPSQTTFEVGGTDIDAFVSTMSNTVDYAKVIIVPVVTLTGSCIRLVTQDYAKHLPKGIPKGAVFNAKSKKAGTIKDLLPDADKYVLIMLPTSHPIPPGEDAIVKKGIPNDVMADTFRAMGPASMSWLEVMTGLDKGVVAYNSDLQKAVLTNHVALDTLFPPGVDPTKFNFTSTTATLHSPPVDEDEDSEVAQAIGELQNLLRACKARNSPATVLSPTGQYPPLLGLRHE